MGLQFILPEGNRLRRLASSLALPKAGSRMDMVMSTPTYAYFLSFPWDGKPARRNRTLDMRTMSVGSWFEAVPWEGISAIIGEPEQQSMHRIPSSLQDTNQDANSTGVAAGKQSSKAGLETFFEGFFEE